MYYRTYLQKQICERIDKVQKLTIPDADDPSEAYWEPTGHSLGQPKSSHDVLKVPIEYCNRL